LINRTLVTSGTGGSGQTDKTKYRPIVKKTRPKSREQRNGNSEFKGEARKGSRAGAPIGSRRLLKRTSQRRNTLRNGMAAKGRKKTTHLEAGNGTIRRLNPGGKKDKQKTAKVFV